MNKNLRNIAPVCLLVFALVLPAWGSLASAASFRDVPQGHHAYEAVEWIANPANGSIMTGDANRNFNPASIVTKFEAVFIFARAAGYKTTAQTITPAERDLYDRAYETYKGMLGTLRARYVKWNQSAERPIAYLLYTGIMTANDVGKIVAKQNGTEQVGSLSRQEAAAFLMRLAEKQEAAEKITLPYHSPFEDDAEILAEYKKLIYFAKESGVASGSDGYLNPARSITRAELAALFFSALSGKKEAAAEAKKSETAAFETVSGIIDEVYPDTHIHITESSAAAPTVFKFAANAVITIDNVKKPASELKKGMQAIATTNAAGEIASLAAREIKQVPEAAAQSAMTETEGVVASVSPESGGTVSIKTRRIKPGGEIIEEENTYTLATSCVIKRGARDVAFSDIKVGDVATIIYADKILHSIVMQGAGVAAEGVRMTSTGIVDEIFVSRTSQRITILKSDETLAAHLVRPGTFDLLTLRIGMEVRLYLEGAEAYDIAVLGD